MKRERRLRSVKKYQAKFPLRTLWNTIKTRTTNPNAVNYRNYGGRGISLCAEWRESSRPFEEYVARVLGPRPEGYSLDRIDPDGNYEPGNIRWADRKTQAANKRPFVQTSQWAADDYGVMGGF